MDQRDKTPQPVSELSTRASAATGRGGRSGEFSGRRASERAVYAMPVVIIREFAQFPHQVGGVPENA